MISKCQRCGFCCTLIAQVNSAEIKKIESVGYERKDFLEKKCLKRKKDGDCVFLVRKGNKTECEIYGCRPQVCKNYPPYSQDTTCKEFNRAVRGYLYWRKNKK